MTLFLTSLDKADPIGCAFAALIGLPAWGVQKGQGSMLTFEFGTPHLSIREPISDPQTDNPDIRRLLQRRHVAIHGEWHLWIGECRWRCTDTQIEQSTDSSPDPQITEAAKFMDGQKLVSVKVDPALGKSAFRFDLGAVLETWPYNEEENDEQWSLYTPSGYVLSYRADGHYAWTQSDQPPDQEIWHLVP